MEGNYPNISSGIVSFENTRTGAKVSIRAADLKNGVYGIKSIVMDTGASYTILPESFAKLLDVSRPTGDKADYYIFSGVGGMSVSFLSLDLLLVGIEDEEGNQVGRKIMPFFLTNYAPSITSEGQLLASEEYQPHTEQIIDFISPPFQYCDDYTVKVFSPNQKFSPQNRRLSLEVDVGKEMNYILIGRDWQEGFKLFFDAERMIIKEGELAKRI
jgi:predicted aspartyl protease